VIVLEVFLRIDKAASGSLQAKLRERISEAIARGELLQGQQMPSTRALARYLGVSRNTVTLAYQDLASAGYLTSQDRGGFFVEGGPVAPAAPLVAPERPTAVDWASRLAMRPSELPIPKHPRDWRAKRYTFIYGQHDRWIFPISDWRKCSRESLSLHDMHDWTVDYVDGDDPMLLDAYRRRALPRRGFSANEQEILVTVGAQHALSLAAQCLVKPGTVVGVEDPCYADARNIFRLFGATLRPLPVDDGGLIVDHRLAGCDIVYVTPSHQSPTTVTMSPDRQRALLAAARQHDVVVIEDDYDTESRFGLQPSPALKSLDEDGRVVYVTSLSKLLSPGLRVGFLVGPRAFMEEARMLRRFGVRHPAANNQRTVALFLKGGHYESLLRKFHREYELRWSTLRHAIGRHLPDARVAPSHGGSSLWVRMPEEVDTGRLAALAYQRDVHIEPGAVHFAAPDQPQNFIRFGFSSIKAHDIEDGIAILARVLDEMQRGRSAA